MCASSMSYPGTSEGGKLPLLPPRGDCDLDDPAKRPIYFESSLFAEACYPTPSMSSGIVEPWLSGWRPRVPNPTATHRNAPHAELLNAQGLLARLVWHQVRLRKSPAVTAREPIDHLYDSKTGPAAPDIELPRARRSPRALATPQATSAPSGPLETLFSHLARRRLRSLALTQRT
jgi:hypothetical protein